MAYIALDLQKLNNNYKFLNNLFNKREIEWSVVTKLLCGYRPYLEELLKLGVNQVCDSMLSNLKSIKSLNSQIETIYIKPPAKNYISGVVKYADISLNTEIQTIELLSLEAVKQSKIHKVIIMIEMGELREGVMHHNFLSFYEKIFKLPNIEVVGIGTNLNCMYGVLPSHDKLIQLTLYAQLLNAKYGEKIKYISGGSSVTIPLILRSLLPKGINHFRVGESLFLGSDTYGGGTFEGMESGLFQLFGQIVELKKKPKVPIGELGRNMEGDKMEFPEEEEGESSYRAVVDIGLLEVDGSDIYPKERSIEVVGSSSDVSVINLGENEKRYKVGDFIEFEMNYPGILRMMSSKYIDKHISKNRGI